MDSKGIRRCCLNDPDDFCYICGEYMTKEHRFNTKDVTKIAYQAYFGIKLGDQDKSWSPHKVCKYYTETLHLWTQGKAKSMELEVPMVWRELKNHHDDCYFCMVKMSGWNRQKKNSWHYPDIHSARRPIPYCSEIQAIEESWDSTNSSNSCNELLQINKSEPFTQGQLNDLVRDLGLSKDASEILASGLSEHHVLYNEAKITNYQHRDEELIRYFNDEGGLCFVITSQDFSQQWHCPNTIQMSGVYLLTALNGV
ncbi:hypothetical protein LOD99_9988 [Oopsacas minuta]|uniref:Uncharacterized protein n=1 Tax=Oopsacas minuta TaxID=111878 RepID=A0AAV7KPY8_9METZ|nr:hypothetical protein LOD99_9988 [Oopsacas minuta]